MHQETTMNGEHVLTLTPREFEDLLEALEATAALPLVDLATMVNMVKNRSYEAGKIITPRQDELDIDSWDGGSWYM